MLQTILTVIALFIVCFLGNILGNILFKVIEKRKGSKDTPIIELMPEDTTPEQSPELPEKIGEYTGILHVCHRKNNGFERPVMKYNTRGKDIYFEYNECGKILYLYHNKDAYEELKAFVADPTIKSKRFKWYPIKKEE